MQAVRGTCAMAVGIVLAFGLAATPAGAARPGCTIFGTDASETWHGVPAGEVLCAGGGDDVVLGDHGIVYGEGGNDLVAFVGPGGVFDGGDGDDQVRISLAGRFIGGMGDDRVQQSRLDSGGIFDGGPGDDRMDVNLGTFIGGPGRDAVWQWTAWNSLFEGGPDDDWVACNDGTFRGGPGVDEVRNVHLDSGGLMPCEVLDPDPSVFEPGPQ